MVLCARCGEVGVTRAAARRVTSQRAFGLQSRYVEGVTCNAECQVSTWAVLMCGCTVCTKYA